MIGSSESNHGLKDSHPQRQGNKPEADAQEIDEESDDESGKDIGEGEDGVEHVILRFVDAQIGLDGILEGLWVVEGVLVAEDHHC